MKFHYEVQKEDGFKHDDDFESFIACNQTNAFKLTRNKEKVTCQKCLKWINNISLVDLRDVYSFDLFAKMMEENKKQLENFLNSGKECAK